MHKGNIEDCGEEYFSWKSSVAGSIPACGPFNKSAGLKAAEIQKMNRKINGNGQSLEDEVEAKVQNSTERIHLRR